MEGEKWKRWVNNTYKLEKEIGIPLETELEEMEKKRKELNNQRDRRRERRRELYQEYLSQQKHYKQITEELNLMKEKMKDYELFSIPKMYLISVDQHDEEMRDLIEDNKGLIKKCEEIMEENRKLVALEQAEPLDYLNL